MDWSLFWIVIRCVYFQWFALALLLISLVAFVIALLRYRSHPLADEKAWFNVGRRFAMLGWIIAVTALVVYIGIGGYMKYRGPAYRKKMSVNVTQTMENHYIKTNSFTQRMLNCAYKVNDPKGVLTEMHTFATNMPKEEREKLGKTWASSLHGGKIIYSGNILQQLMDRLYWDQKKVSEYEKAHGFKPGEANNSYTDKQIEYYKNGQWSKLYPALDKTQWIFIKNQILDIKKVDDVYGFLRDMTDAFQDPETTESIKELYKKLLERACPTEDDKVALYLAKHNGLLKFYRFCNRNFWWHSCLPALLICIIVGVLFITSGNKVAMDGRRKLFKC